MAAAPIPDIGRISIGLIITNDDPSRGFRTPGNGGTVVDVSELVAARKGLNHNEDSYQQMIDHIQEYTDIAPRRGEPLAGSVAWSIQK
jgi:hypothetical protein